MQKTPIVATSTSPCSAGTSIEPFTEFTRVVPGQSTEKDVIDLLGTPLSRVSWRNAWPGLPDEQRKLHPDWTSLIYHTGPNGGIVLDGNIVIAWTAVPASPLSVKNVVAHYGLPDQTLRRISHTTAGYSSTYLTYPCQGFVFEIINGTPAPGTQIDSVWKMAPGYFGKFMEELRAFTTSNGDEYTAITWPDFSTPPTP